MRTFGRPALLSFGILLSGLGGFLTLLFLPLAALRLGTYELNGQSVSPSEYLHRAGWFDVLLGPLLLLIARDLYRAHPRGRALVMCFWLFVGGVAVGTSRPDARLAFVGMFLALAAFAAWYFYRKRTVTAYFDEAHAPDA